MAFSTEQRPGDLKKAVLLLTEHNGGHLGAEARRVIVRRQQCLEALDALARVEELLVGLHDFVDAVCAETEVLRHERASVGGEDAVGQLEIEEPVAVCPRAADRCGRRGTCRQAVRGATGA
ncbi:MAG: hypothetical protein V9G13_14630 [Marmoricola sp.]